MSDSLRHHGLHHTRLPCPSPTIIKCIKTYILMFLFISACHLMHFLGCAHTNLETVALIHRIILCVCVWSLSCVWLFVIPWTIAFQASLSMGFSRQKYWSRLPFPSLGDLPDPGIEPRSPVLQADDLLTELLMKAETIVEA